MWIITCLFGWVVFVYVQKAISFMNEKVLFLFGLAGFCIGLFMTKNTEFKDDYIICGVFSVFGSIIAILIYSAYSVPIDFVYYPPRLKPRDNQSSFFFD